MQENNEKINLQIKEQFWSGWVEKQREPKVEIIMIKKGEIIKKEYKMGSSLYAFITIEDIKDDVVVVNFNTDGVGGNKECDFRMGGGKYNWTVEIKYNEEYEIMTLALDQGCTWRLTFIKNE
jgi:hypothetical protein